MASPAQVANDMAARAAFWRGRDDRIAREARGTANVLRAYLDGETVHSGLVTGVLTRLYGLDEYSLVNGNAELRAAFNRAAATIIQLRKGASDAAR